MKATRRAALTLVALGLLAFAAPAAADRVYFTNTTGIYYADLGGGAATKLQISGTSVNEAHGLAIDPAAGKIYWSAGQGGSSRIGSANLDGSSGMNISTSGAPINQPKGVALDHQTGRIYWGNYQGPLTERIGYAGLDGSGGSHLDTTGATAGNVQGVAIELTARRLYWANESGSVAYAALDGSGGANVNLTGASPAPSYAGVAIDPSSQRIYWTSHQNAPPYKPVVSSAALDNSGGANLATPGAPEEFAEGVAIDPSANRIYWAGNGVLGEGDIYYAALDGSGAHSLNLSGTTVNSSTFPVLLKAPLGTEAPQLTLGIASRPRFLICDEGKWADDLPQAQLYRAPRSVSYQWVEDGAPIPGATRSEIGVEGRPGGDYACQVTATNAAGATTQTSKVQFVCCPITPKAKGARVALVKGGRAQLKLTCPAGTEPCAGRIHLETARPLRKSARSSAIYGERSISIPPAKTQVVKVKLSHGTKSKLRKSSRHRLKATLDGRAVEKRIVVLKLASKPKRGH